MSLDQRKQAVRERVWTLLESQQASPYGVHGKIPTFYGAERAAERLAELPDWQQARVVKANPDQAQLHVRARALRDGKIVYMAVPRMAAAKPFYLLDPSQLDVPPEKAAAKAGAAGIDLQVGVDEMRPIDIVICGSVAVDRSGARIGKGAGYSDLEVALLIEAGLVTDRTVIVAPVHRLQVIDEAIPVAEHDFNVDIIVTPEAVIPCPRAPRPNGLVWKSLSPDKIAAIPVLAERAKGRSANHE